MGVQTELPVRERRPLNHSQVNLSIQKQEYIHFVLKTVLLGGNLTLT